MDETEDETITVTSQNTANVIETRSYSQDSVLAAVWDAVVQIEVNTNLVVGEHRE